MDDIDYLALKTKLDEVTIRNIRLEKDKKNMVKSIRHYKRVIRGYKKKLEEKEKGDEQYYRNGRKRGNYGIKG